MFFVVLFGNVPLALFAMTLLLTPRSANPRWSIRIVAASSLGALCAWMAYRLLREFCSIRSAWSGEDLFIWMIVALASVGSGLLLILLVFGDRAARRGSPVDGGRFIVVWDRALARGVHGPVFYRLVSQGIRATAGRCGLEMWRDDEESSPTGLMILIGVVSWSRHDLVLLDRMNRSRNRGCVRIVDITSFSMSDIERLFPGLPPNMVDGPVVGVRRDGRWIDTVHGIGAAQVAEMYGDSDV